MRPPKVHVERDLRPHDLPRVSEAEPLVGQLDLPAVANRLVENPELVTEAVADRRNVERRERIHVAGGQPSQPAVAQAGLFFLFEQAGQVLSNRGQRLLCGFPDSQVDQAVAEMRAGQELG